MTGARPDFGLVEAGLYTIPEAAELVGADRRAVRVWVEGRPGKQYPVLDNQVGRIGKTVAISFTNLMELRFIAVFAKAGVRLNVIRSIIDDFRDEVKLPHPLATNIVFRTDGRRIFGQVAKKHGIDLFDYRSKNYEMLPLLIPPLKEDVKYDLKGEAIYWTPRAKVAPNVIVHPSFSFGQPIIKKSRIPTEALAKAASREKSIRFVAEIYEIPEAQVREAVRFERELRMAA